MLDRNESLLFSQAFLSKYPALGMCYALIPQYTVGPFKRPFSLSSPFPTSFFPDLSLAQVIAANTCAFKYFQQKLPSPGNTVWQNKGELLH